MSPCFKRFCFKSCRAPGHGAFTLIELLVSIAILSIILLVLGSITAQVQVIWKGTSAKIEQYRSARVGFETMTQRLAQATLNTYLGYSDSKNPGDTFYNTPTFAPTSYTRLSELRFLSGQSATTMSSVTPAAIRPTQSVFFLAPLGYSPLDTSYKSLTQLLNVCGYYLEYGTDTSLPAFILSATGYQPRYRYRLMEMIAPSETNSIYSYTTQPPGNSKFHSQDWIKDAFTLAPPPVHILAENIIALIILPQLGQDQKNSNNLSFPSYALAPYYGYDSSYLGAAGSPSLGDPTGGSVANGSADAGALNSSSQLPPLVQVTMVAIDEPSALRIQNQFGAAAPDFGLNTLFQDASKYDADLGQLKANLEQGTYTDAGGTYNPTVDLPKKINYHVFTTTISIKGAQWSTIQAN